MSEATPDKKIAEKIVTPDQLAAKLKKLREEHPGIRIGFTNGTFTIPHPGHFYLFEQCRQGCDFLIVAMNSTASLKTLGRTKETMGIDAERMNALAGQDPVGAVIAFDEPDAVRVMEACMPDTLFKGDEGHTRSEDYPEAIAAKKHRIAIKLIPPLHKDRYSATYLNEVALRERSQTSGRQ